MNEQDDDSKTGDDEVDIIATAVKRFDMCYERYDKDYQEFDFDLGMVAGFNQWDEEAKAERQRKNRPCHTYNHLPQFVNRVANAIRETSLSIKVLPADDQANTETAYKIRAMIRKIESKSQADLAYDQAAQNAICGGVGYFRVLTRYVDEKSFDQEIYIDPLPNSTGVYLDPHHKRPDGSDAKYAFIFDTISKEDFKKQYPDASLEEFGNKKQSSGWISDDSVRIAEYYVLEEKPDTLYLLSDGSTVLKSELDKPLKKGEYEDERETTQTVLKWYKINGHEILDETTIPCRYIPICKVVGWELWIEGKNRMFSMVRHARDPQKAYNFIKTTHLEVLATQPKSPFIATMEQIEGHEELYKSANVDNLPILPYNPHVHKGQLLPPPMRQPPPQASDGLFREALGYLEDIKSSIGVFDTALGMEGNEVAGVAIKRREVQGDNATFHYVDNLARAIRHCGCIIVDMIPSIYKGKRTERVEYEDGTEDFVKFNQPVLDKDEDGQEITTVYDLEGGKYEVTVDVGRSYATKRQEALDHLLTLVQSVPEVLGVAGDLIAKNMEWEGAEEIAKRLQHLLPPELKGEDRAAIVEQQAKQMIDMLQGRIGQLEGALQDKSIAEDNKRKLEEAKLILEQRKLDLEEVKIRAEAFKDMSEGMEAMQAEIADRDSAISELMDFITETHGQKDTRNSPVISNESNIKNERDSDTSTTVRDIPVPDGDLSGGE